MNQATFKTALALAALWAGTFSPATAATSEINFVPDVEQQFRDLMPRPDAMGFGIGVGIGASTCKHFQGVVRHHGPDGTPYLILSRNGSAECILDNPTGHGYIYIVRMDSRDSSGERLRSNRIARVTGSGDPASDKNFITDRTPPEQGDEIVKMIYLNGTDGWPHFMHPGGMQIIGDVLAVPLEKPYLPCFDLSCLPDPEDLKPRILFIDISDPEDPRYLYEHILQTGGSQVGAVAITKLPDGHYLMAVLRPQSYKLEIYQSTGTDLMITGPFRTRWTLRDVWYPDELLGGAEWPAGLVNSHQMLNFVREGDINGPLYLIGGRKDALVIDVDEYFDLYRVELIDWDLASPNFQLTRIVRKKIIPKPLTGGLKKTLDLKAASGVYVSPSGELILYACEHGNDGPEVNGVDSVKCGEFRHVNIQRPDNPGYAPAPFLNGEFEVDEGGATELSAYAEAPLSRAWIQLFTASGLNYEYNIGVVAEYDDWHKEDYDDFAKLGVPMPEECTTTGETTVCTTPPPEPLDSAMSSMRWFAPKGCTIIVSNQSLDNASNGHVKLLSGTGEVKIEPDLSEVFYDGGNIAMNDNIRSVVFDLDCDDYYNETDFTIDWDMDNDGLFETSSVRGSSAFFSAAGLEGPGTAEIGIQATHPRDGLAGTGKATIKVNNVPPEAHINQILNTVKLDANGLPIAITHVNITLNANFTDQGVQDTHDSPPPEVHWGDGVVYSSLAELEQFADSFGGVIGNIVARHAYDIPGVYPIALAITDDDGGRGTDAERWTVQAEEPEGARQLLVNSLLQLIQANSDINVDILLRDAVNKLNEMADDVALYDPEVVSFAIEILDILNLAEGEMIEDISPQKSLLVLIAQAMTEKLIDHTQSTLSPLDATEISQLDQLQQMLRDAEALHHQNRHLDALNGFLDIVNRCFMLLG